jgi:hypothetical protein
MPPNRNPLTNLLVRGATAFCVLHGATQPDTGISIAKPDVATDA